MKKPLIGIGADIVAVNGGSRESIYAFQTYVQAIRRAGGSPLIIPPQPENAREVVESLDGLLLVGGDDCDPAEYGERPHPSVKQMDRRRQDNDLALARAARAHGIPTLGVCLGMQMMSVIAGGSLIQDIPSELESSVRHESEPDNRRRHPVTITEGSRLSQILGVRETVVNSSHHQAVRTPGEGLRVVAQAADGVIEGLEDSAHPFYVGVQWHPEDMAGERSATLLFEAFVEAASKHAGESPASTPERSR